jgi:phospholipase/lecithinase/hemolysin
VRAFTPLAIALFLAAATPVASASPFSSIVVYGDSLSDNGNLYAATGGLAPAAPYVGGEFSNGPVAAQQLAALWGIPLLDFAFGGATTGIGNIADGGTPTSLGADGLPGMQAELALSAGRVPSAIIPSSLFIVWGGADDFESLTDPTVTQSEAAAVSAVTDIDGIVDALRSEGATNILVPNLPNLGSTPEFNGDAAAIAYSSTFDTALAVTLPSGATLFDTNALFTQILTNPNAYGFTNTTTPCLVASANPACPGYLFFDDIHPTTAADTILAHDFAAAATPEPSALLLMGTGLAAGIAFLLRRRMASQE